jgi:adenosylhomocysteine nucleosidase
MSSLVKIRIAIIAAMEREVRPLIRSWKMRTMEQGGRRYRVFENGGAVLVCGGIGAEAARRATEAVIREVSPVRVISVGFAGALDHSLQVGHVFEPRAVINASDGVRTEVGSGQEILVSSATVADKEQKGRFRKAYGASAVDMEAAAVAQGAQAQGVEFGALKAISDGADFNLPAIDRFVADDGSFRSAKFAYHVALRPWLWETTISLARNSSKASHALCDALRSYLDRQILDGQASDRQIVGRQALPDESSVAKLNLKKVSAESGGVHTRTGAQSHNQAEGEQ